MGSWHAVTSRALRGVLLSALLATGACDGPTTAAGAALDAAAQPPALPPELALQLAAYRPDDPVSDGLFRFTTGHNVESFDGVQVRVFFTRSGPDQVATLDADRDGVPDQVAAVAGVYDEVLSFYEDLGFRGPRTDLGTAQGDGGDGRLDVYLVDFAGAADGAWVRERCDRSLCSGYVVQENDFAGYGYSSFTAATRVLASHELFHAIQAAYDADQGANWSEGSAVWATERFDETMNDFESLARGWLAAPQRSLQQDPIGPVDAFSYGVGLFVHYLWERWGDAVQLALWEGVVDGADGLPDPHWRDVLEVVLERDYNASFEEAWTTFVAWTLRSGWGDAGGPTFRSARNLAKISRETVELPWEKARLRVYPTSAQVWSVPGRPGRGVIEAAWVAADAEALDGLVWVIGRRVGNRVLTEVRTEAQVEVDAAGQDEVLFAVVNVLRDGASKRPGLCIGAAEDVQACRERLLGPEVSDPGPEAVEEVASEAAEAGSAEVVERAEVVEDDGAVADHDRVLDRGGCGAGGTAGAGALWLLGWALGARRRLSRHRKC